MVPRGGKVLRLPVLALSRSGRRWADSARGPKANVDCRDRVVRAVAGPLGAGSNSAAGETTQSVGRRWGGDGSGGGDLDIPERPVQPSRRSSN